MQLGLSTGVGRQLRGDESLRQGALGRPEPCMGILWAHRAEGERPDA